MKTEIKNIGVYSFTVWSGLFITAIDVAEVTFRYGYHKGDKMVYKRRVTKELDYTHTPEWSEEVVPSFMYKNQRYFIDEFMRL